MPNVSLLPGEKEQSFEDLIAATDKGIAIIGDGSFSIDQQRYNAQFGGQLFYEIRGGKITGMLNNLEAIGRAERIAGTESGGNVVMPTIKVRDFNFTSLSDAV